MHVSNSGWDDMYRLCGDIVNLDSVYRHAKIASSRTSTLRALCHGLDVCPSARGSIIGINAPMHYPSNILTVLFTTIGDILRGKPRPEILSIHPSRRLIILEGMLITDIDHPSAGRFHRLAFLIVSDIRVGEYGIPKILSGCR